MLPDGRIELTAYGRAFVHYDRSSQRQALRRLLRECEPTASVLQTLRATGELQIDDIAGMLKRIAPLAGSTAHRRARTVISWLVTIGLATWRDSRLRYHQSATSTSGLKHRIS